MNLDGFMQRGPDGTVHFDVPKFLDAIGYADTPANRDMVIRTLKEVAPKQWPGVSVYEDPAPMPSRPRGRG